MGNGESTRNAVRLGQKEWPPRRVNVREPGQPRPTGADMRKIATPVKTFAKPSRP